MPKYNEILKKAKRNGCRFIRFTKKGEEWESQSGETLTIHAHGAEEVSPGMLQNIKK